MWLETFNQPQSTFASKLGTESYYHVPWCCCGHDPMRRRQALPLGNMPPVTLVTKTPHMSATRWLDIMKGMLTSECHIGYYCGT